ncbi:MAG: hypothetical protein HGA54_02305 [Actinobacteria bacterium]|nr:hypothetical protein [Actinomycetota bacterium]
MDFSWSGVDALKQMSTTAVKWEYYSCPKPFFEVAAFFKEQTPDPPYAKQENNWVESRDGIMGVYFDADSELRLVRLWFLPQPGDAQASHLVVMRFNGMLRGNFPSTLASKN